jgi:hypothetical protein
VQENAAVGLGVVPGNSKAGSGWQLESLGPHAGKYPLAGVDGLGQRRSFDPGKQFGGQRGSEDPIMKG